MLKSVCKWEDSDTTWSWLFLGLGLQGSAPNHKLWSAWDDCWSTLKLTLLHNAEADNGLAPASSGIEDLREKGELQKAFYGFLHAITVSNLSHILLQTPSDTLHRALTALVAGGAGHVDPGTRKTCLQVWVVQFLAVSDLRLLSLVLRGCGIVVSSCLQRLSFTSNWHGHKRSCVLVHMSTQVFLFYGMICSNLWHVARAEIAIKSPSNFNCSTLQDTTILFHDFQNKRIYSYYSCLVSFYSYFLWKL